MLRFLVALFMLLLPLTHSFAGGFMPSGGMPAPATQHAAAQSVEGHELGNKSQHGGPMSAMACCDHGQENGSSSMGDCMAFCSFIPAAAGLSFQMATPVFARVAQPELASYNRFFLLRPPIA
ncbi:hypothetical protein PUV47_13600 [Pseudovibrio exalbescens]|uniref:hypothetical protein n=1 Tax=Pseudovibrio exalbescens TaxID=197461 RepID=UPI0023656810|nr:hypothetical protein [Pseudovibrio exalbescens]MDD7910958.1 hypothetical protein [Pseudovibrio exalbescens]